MTSLCRVFAGANAKLKQQSDSQANLDAETQKRISILQKEKDEMLTLAMTRGKLISVNIKLNFTASVRVFLLKVHYFLFTFFYRKKERKIRNFKKEFSNWKET